MRSKGPNIKLILSLIAVFISASIPKSSATDVSGDVWGEWTAAGNPYNVIGDLRVPPGSTLVIGPGCYIEFQGYYRFLVDASAVLQAIGTEIDSIIFTTADSTVTWDGFQFSYADTGSQLSYCRLERGHGAGHNDGGAIQCNGSYLELRNSFITENIGSFGSAIHLQPDNYIIVENNLFVANRGYSVIYSVGNEYIKIAGNTFTGNDSTTIIETADRNDAMSITENIFHHNIYCGIVEIDGGGITIENNVIYDNLGVMFISWQGSGPTLFRRNIIYGNYCPWSWAGGIFLTEDSYFIVENNTICNNSGVYRSYLGMILEEHGINGPVIFKNNIIWGNYYTNPEDSLILIDPDINFSQTYSDIQGGWGDMGNIMTDPIFVDTANGDFHLMPGSPCIDTGDPASPLDPDSTRADMGALYFDQTTGINLPPPLPREITLYQNYPNPFNAQTAISFNLPYGTEVLIEVYDMLGRRVAVLADEYYSAGSREITWDGKPANGDGLSSGIYFYRLQAGDFDKTNKMLLLK
ncbi:MAG: right-handed parallel beta-helix repeat-containing protein [Candidatus Zixiibacteriota bacterium]|nr:MAG: right-handed parallel beta-helix repeat-containing protein [candidate division Zixibacteria bacterium]